MKTREMWSFGQDGLITHHETGLQFSEPGFLWRVTKSSRSRKRTLDKRSVYLLELECSLWAYGRKLEVLEQEAA